MIKIRNGFSLNLNELNFINTLPRNELLVIININNIHLERINEYFSYEKN